MRARLKKTAKRVASRIPGLGGLVQDRDALREQLDQLRRAADDTRQFVPPGHFYSPIPSLSDVRRSEDRLFAPPPRQLPGIDVREEQQLALLRSFQPFYDEQPFPTNRAPSRRYFFENDAYSYSDALCLYSMIRHLRPRRIIEVGSGYSSSVMLDTRELFFGGGDIDCTFIEPSPELLRSLLKPGDAESVSILPKPVQTVELGRFEELEANDILFIDSTHVSRIGSDVNYLLFEVLPRLAAGVYVHFHDIFYPFEYPRHWIYEGRAWTEVYLLRCMLTHSAAWEVTLFNTFLAHFHRSYFEQHMPLCLKNTGGSIWIRRRSVT